MKEHPMIFTLESVKAILEGCKTQSRRVIKPQPFIDEKLKNLIQWKDFIAVAKDPENINKEFGMRCPYGQVGDRLWVRETFSINYKGQILLKREKENISELLSLPDIPIKWTPSIFLPRKYSRITLEITEIRVQKLQEISQDDAVTEGMKNPEYAFRMIAGGDVEVNESPKELFAELWDSINAKRGYTWESNPWVWCLSFKRIAPIKFS